MYTYDLARRYPVAALPQRTHTQTIGGNAQVGVAVAGDVLGGINHVQQSGGINLGSGNTIDRIGDLVAGDKIRSYAVVAIERFSACGSKVLILSVLRFSARRAEKRSTLNNKKYRSAEGR
jgi:hypothetical protein